MSPTNRSPRPAARELTRAARARRGQRPLAFALALFAASAALTLSAARDAAAQPRGDKNLNANLNSQPGNRGEPLLTLRARPRSVAVCPGRPAPVRLTPVPAAHVRLIPEYSWKVEAGHVKVTPDGVTWDLSGVKPGTYTATVTVSPAHSPAVMLPGISASARVAVRACREQNSNGDTPANTSGTTNTTNTATPTPTASTPTPATPSPSAPAPANVPVEPSPPAAAPDVQGAGVNRWWLILAGLAALLAAGLLLAKLLPPRSAKKELQDSSHEVESPPAQGARGSAGAVASIKGARDVIVGARKKAADRVHCTVFAPEQAAPGDPFVVQVFAHLARQAGQLAARAARADDAAEERGSAALPKPVARGTQITFRLRMDGLTVHDPQKSLVWDGEVNGVQFAVDVPEDFARANVRGEVRIYYGRGKAPVGEVMFMFRVAPGGAAAGATFELPQRHVRYTHAFVSYSSKDLDKVLLALRGLREGWEHEGVTYFFDRREIRSGEHWRKVIRANLDSCDLFVLFWSSAAKGSEEVGKEVAYALARKGGRDDSPPAFEPFTIEKPVPVPLPEGLESLHFGDELLNYMSEAEKP